jgi:hypothetical protein
VLLLVRHTSDFSANTPSTSDNTPSNSNNGSSSALVPYPLATRSSTATNSVLHTLVVEVQPADTEIAKGDTGEHKLLTATIGTILCY